MVEELKPMLENISGKKLDELCDDECLFSRKYAMNARDIVYFLVEIEERYGVVFDKEKINNPDFFTLKNISNELLAKRELKNCSDRVILYKVSCVKSNQIGGGGQKCRIGKGFYSQMTMRASVRCCWSPCTSTEAFTCSTRGRSMR